MKWLIFIDTNIFLDFYRIPSGSVAMLFLDHIDTNKNIIITSDQVQMEYKKNRQKVILETMKKIKSPGWETVNVPAFLTGANLTEGLSTNKKQLDKRLIKIKERMMRVLTNAETHDPVYKTANDFSQINQI